MNKGISEKDVVEDLKGILGPQYVLTNAVELQSFGVDWTKVFKPDPLCVLLPSSTDEISKILRYCNDNGVPVVPSGGRTGLCGGAVAANKEVVLSLNRMNKIEKIDTVGMTITAQAGVTTETLQIAAREVGLFFPLDLAAKGSCQIGGNIATNAGGVKLIRYGGTREQVLGIEVVLADGRILNMNSALRKNNSGYDLKQLFIASEGTLGVVTRCTLKLAPKPKFLQAAILGLASFENILDVLNLCNKSGLTLTAFEFFTQVAHEIVLKHSKGARSPFSNLAPYYVLLEIESQTDSHDDLADFLAKLHDQGSIIDAVIAQSSAQFREFWSLRENITESLNSHGQVRKNDIALAVDTLAPFLKDLQVSIMSKSPANIALVLFGHIGDGNLHINYVASRTMDTKEFSKVTRDIETQVFHLLKKYNGSISAEHGIGLTKKSDLHFTRSEDEVEWMRKIKTMFDPKGILNPGKIF